MTINNKLRIGFMGTPDFAVPALDALRKSGHEIPCVYTQPPRPKGRGHKIQRSPVHEYAEEHGVPVFTPKSLKGANTQEEFAAHNLDVAVIAAYGLLLPRAILEAPKYGCLNIHASLLPRWRGASPIQQAIRAGDKETGISIMQMDEGLDTGPVIREQTVPITGDTTASSLHDTLCKIGGGLIMDVINRLAAGETGLGNRLPAAAQDEAKATYAPLLSKENGRIDWSQTAGQIDRQIRALNPWPGVWTTFKSSRIKILNAVLPPCRDAPSPPQAGRIKGGSGTILDKAGHIACGNNTVIQITKIQPSGAAKAMDFASAINGGYISADEVFS